MAALAPPLLAAALSAQASDLRPACEAYSQSEAVFVAVAAAPEKRWIQLPDHPPIEMTLTPMTVERAYLGATPPVMYLTPLGVQHYATPGKTYLVYGRSYRPPDVVMASPGHGAKEIGGAIEDLAFLDALIPGAGGGMIAGIVQQKEVTYERANIRGPLEGILVRIFNASYSTEAITAADGRFVVSGIPGGEYQLVPQLPEGLVVRDSTSRITALVREGGCATPTIDVIPNGRVRGVLRGPNGRPLRSTSVDLIPVDLNPDAITGHVSGSGSVSTNDNGEFEFAGRSPGRYYLGVSLYNAPNPHGPSYPRTYYPGTSDRTQAVPVIVEQGRATKGWTSQFRRSWRRASSSLSWRTTDPVG